MSQFAAKNLGAIKAALDQHNASCPVPANAILLNPVDHALIDFEELWGLPVLADDRVPTKRVRIQCDGSAFGIEDEVADAVAREEPATVPMVIPVGPGEIDQVAEGDLSCQGAVAEGALSCQGAVPCPARGPFPQAT